MRAIHMVKIDKWRPAVVLTRQSVLSVRTAVTVAPITSTVRGLDVEVPVGPENGIDHRSVINCDNITTVRSDDLGRQVGLLLAHQEAQLAEAIVHAFDLRPFAR